jgi:hypothetical protein
LAPARSLAWGRRARGQQDADGVAVAGGVGGVAEEEPLEHVALDEPEEDGAEVIGVGVAGQASWAWARAAMAAKRGRMRR